MRKLKAENYDFLWKVENMTFPYHSIWLTKEILQRDFIATYQGISWKVYVGKAQRKKLGLIGYRLMVRGLPKFIKETRVLLRDISRRLDQLQKLPLERLSDEKLRLGLLTVSRCGQELWSHYFRTEYFCYDLVNEKIQRGGDQAKFLRSQVRRMQKIKLSIREEINRVGFGSGVSEKIFSEVARRKKITNLQDWSFQELSAAMKRAQGRVPDRSTYVMGKFNDWQVVTGRIARTMIQKLESITHPKHGSELHGQVGNRGTYRGRVRIIPFDLTADHERLIKEMKKGEVLVSGSTGPEMIMACRKAGAIVTEEGGITSHAAIVSRELGIPCVIGTKVATDVLKNGDLVEVDAMKGIVRKIG